MMPYIVRQKAREAYWAFNAKKGYSYITHKKSEATRYDRKDWAEMFAVNQKPECVVEKVKD